MFSVEEGSKREINTANVVMGRYLKLRVEWKALLHINNVIFMHVAIGMLGNNGAHVPKVVDREPLVGLRNVCVYLVIMDKSTAQEILELKLIIVIMVIVKLLLPVVGLGGYLKAVVEVVELVNRN